MSEGASKPASGRRWVKNCLIGCLGAVVLSAMLVVSGCVGFYLWINATAPVTDRTVLLTGGEDAFGVVYLTPEDEALLELVTTFLRRHQELQRQLPGIQRYLPQGDPRENAEQQLEQTLPVRIEGALYPAAGNPAPEHLVKIEISHQYRWYQLIFRGIAFAISLGGDDRNVRIEEHDGLTMIVGREEGGREHGFIFTGNTFFWGSPPRRVAGAAALTPDEPARFHAADSRLPLILRSVEGETNPVWGLVTGPTLRHLADWAAASDVAALSELTELVEQTGTETVAFGFDLETARYGTLRVAGLVPPGAALDGSARQRLAQPLEARTAAGLELDLSCDADDADRWSCNGTVQGFDRLVHSLVDEWESQLDQQP